jgi:protein-S-isoprenylcysteine O-methyltransferase Ste14
VLLSLSPKLKDGLYAHVRNPMIIGVFFILAGEVFLFFNSKILLAYSLFFIFVNLFYIRLFEEVELVVRFGEEYIIYKKNIPAWIPRFKSWKPEE